MRRGPFLLGVLVLAGCGGGSPPPHVTPKQPRLPSALTAPWRAQADAVAAALAAGDGCLAQQRATELQNAVIDAVNHHLLPPRFQEPLVGAVSDLKDRITCTPPPPAPVTVEHGRGHEKPHEHGKHGKHGEHGGDD